MKTIRLLAVFVFTCSSLLAQETKPPFYNDIQSFKKQDSVQMPPSHAILFVGSSSFTKWTDVQDYFPKYTIINRGFGGSTLPDLVRYANDVIIPYHAKQVVIYCGENDLAAADTVTPVMVLQRFVTLFRMIRKADPNVPIAFISLKPSPSRQHLWKKMEQSNLLIRNFIAKQKQAVFIDVYHKMFNKNGKVMQDIFIEDNLHMNAKGYHIWQKIIQPYLVK